jgi:cytidylate kinase
VIVAIDGPAGSGKSAVGRRVAEALGLPFVDSGLMYRAIALLALERGIELTDGATLTRLAGKVRLSVEGRRLWIDDREYTDRLYAPELSEGASLVGKIAGVRLALVAQQRALGRDGVVMAGRDIGTVVFPDTRYKFFLTASVEERARRRAAQIESRGGVPDSAELRREVEERDRRDSQRSVAPMHAADDALVVETDHLDLDGVVAEVLRTIGEPA